MHFRHARARGVVASRERTRARRARIKSHRRLDARSLASARRARRAGTSTSSHYAARARVDRRLASRAMPRARPNKVAYYAVAVGRKTGVYTTWDDAKRQVDAFGGAKHKARSRAPRRALASRARRAIGD
jgi:hypothetical protein